MIRFSTFTRGCGSFWRTTSCHGAAVVGSFFVRFEEVARRALRFLAILLPLRPLFRPRLRLLRLYKAKWRFTSLPDLYNIVRATTVLR